MKRTRELLRAAKAAGWRVARTRGGHLRFQHPDAAQAVIASGTPGDRRARANTLADLRRALNHRRGKDLIE